MATVVDALIVTLGLDPKDFTKGQKEAGESLLKMQRDVDDKGKKVAQTVNQVRNQVLAMFAAFMAGKGLREFVSDVVAAGAETARFAHVLNSIPEELSAWRGVATLAGGTADGLTQSVMGLTQEFQRFALTGESSVIPYFRALNVNISDVNTGKMREFGDILLDLSDRFQNMDPAKATAFGKAIGLDQGTINMLLKGRVAVQDMIAEQKRLGVITKEDAKAALALQHAWLSLQQASTSMGRTLLTDVAPVLVTIINGFKELAIWVRGHKPLLQAFVATLVAAGVALSIAFAPVTLTVVGITLAVVALAAAVGLLYDDWKTFTEGGKSALGGLWDFASRVFNLIKTLFTGTGAEIRKAVKDLFGGIGQDVTNAGSLFGRVVSAIGYGIQTMVASSLNWVIGRINAFWTAITGRGDLITSRFEANGKIRPATKPSGAPPPANTPSGDPKAQAWAAAQASEAKYGIPARVTYAQWALESNYGKNMPAGSNNPFGIKATGRQDAVEAQTKEFVNGQMVTMKQRFAKYATMQDAFDAHAKLLATSKHYARARGTSSDTAFADALTGVYATDPNYGAKLKSIMGRTPGARDTAMARGGGGNTTTTSHQTKIEKVVVNTQATDAAGIARDIKPAIERDTFASQAQYAAG